jgi:hypothetical protein
MPRQLAFRFAFAVTLWAVGLAVCSLLDCGGKALLERASTGAGSLDAGSATCSDTQYDDRNCGACGAVCSGTCYLGHCTVTLASGQANVGCIAVDASSIYWVNAGVDLDEGSGEIRKAPLSGGKVTTLVTAPGADISWPCRMKIGDSNLYWTSGDYGGPLFRVPIAGGTPLMIAPDGLGGTSLVLDDTSVYWTNPYNGARKAALDGSMMTTLVMQVGRQIAVNATHVYWTFGDDPNPDGGQIMSLPLSGGTPTTVAGGLDDPWPIAADASGAYWVDYGDGKVMRAAPDGTVTTLASGQYATTTIAIDDANVYWAAAGYVTKVPKLGGTPTQLALEANAFDVAVDATSVYWTNGDHIMKVTPK